MPRYVALFRGINVGKAKRVAMADLRALLEKLGYTDVRTLLNSGNAVFTGGAAAPDKHAQRIRTAVARKLGVDACVIVKSDKDIAGIIAGNALDKIATNPSRLLVAMTADGKALAALKAARRPGLGQGKSACRQARGLRLVRRWHPRKPGPGRRCSRPSGPAAPRATGPRSTGSMP